MTSTENTSSCYVLSLLTNSSLCTNPLRFVAFFCSLFIPFLLPLVASPLFFFILIASVAGQARSVSRGGSKSPARPGTPLPTHIPHPTNYNYPLHSPLHAPHTYTPHTHIPHTYTPSFTVRVGLDTPPTPTNTKYYSPQDPLHAHPSNNYLLFPCN